MPKEEENKLFIKAKNGDLDARKRVIECNLRYVIYIASKYKKYSSDFMELVQEGNIGLVEAFEKFDVSYDVKFAFYARYYIEKHIRDIIRKCENIIIPINIYSSRSKISKYENEKLIKENRKPNLSEISKNVNIPEQLLESMFEALNEMTSLNTSIGEDDSSSLIEFIAYDEEINLESYVLNKMFSDKIKENLKKCLTKRQFEIIEYKYGINDGVCKSLRECMEKFGVTYQCIQNIETRAIKRLSLRLDYLKEEYNE